MARAEQQQKWANLIADYRASGLSAKKWCAANQVKFSQLKYRLYRRKIEPAAQPTKWLPVSASASEGAGDPYCLV